MRQIESPSALDVVVVVVVVVAALAQRVGGRSTAIR